MLKLLKFKTYKQHKVNLVIPIIIIIKYYYYLLLLLIRLQSCLEKERRQYLGYAALLIY
jgi:hypothetical protein